MSSDSSEDDAPSARLKALSELRRAATSLGRLSSLRSGPVAALLSRMAPVPSAVAGRASAPPPCPTCGGRARRRPPSSTTGEVPEQPRSSAASARAEGASSSTAPSTPRSTTDDHHARNVRDQQPAPPVQHFPPCPPGFPERPPPLATPQPAPDTEAAAIATVELVLDALKRNDEPLPDTGISTALAFIRSDAFAPWPWHVFLTTFRRNHSRAIIGHISRTMRTTCYEFASDKVDCRICVDLEHEGGRRARAIFYLHMHRHTPPGGRIWTFQSIEADPANPADIDTS